MRTTAMLLLLSLFAVTSCMEHVSPPPRPKGVPADAVWAGGADGGSFIKCSFDPSAGLNFCTVYNDFTGKIEAEGRFAISGPARPEDVTEFSFSGFDGKKIYLKDGSILNPTADVVFPVN
jgi:hypothetical protein